MIGLEQPVRRRWGEPGTVRRTVRQTVQEPESGAETSVCSGVGWDGASGGASGVGWVTPRMRALRLFSGKWAAVAGGMGVGAAVGIGIVCQSRIRIIIRKRYVRKIGQYWRTYVGGRGRSADQQWRRGYICGYQAYQQAGKSRGRAEQSSREE
jgi:hypothetical protein